MQRLPPLLQRAAHFSHWGPLQTFKGRMWRTAQSAFSTSRGWACNEILHPEPAPGQPVPNPAVAAHPLP